MRKKIEIVPSQMDLIAAYIENKEDNLLSCYSKDQLNNLSVEMLKKLHIFWKSVKWRGKRITSITIRGENVSCKILSGLCEITIKLGKI